MSHPEAWRLRLRISPNCEKTVQKKEIEFVADNTSQTNSIGPADLESLLQGAFLANVIHFRETDSTNTRAIELLAARDSVTTPCLVYAESQFAGRGRGANQWWSTGGSLTFSLIVDLKRIGLSVDQVPLLPLLTGMAILRTGAAMLPGADFKLKWPNDVILAGRKLAGVLIEVPSQSDGHAVIGVGLNVNNSFANAPEELSFTGISLSDQRDAKLSRIEVLRTLLEQFEVLLNSLAAGEGVFDHWSDCCLLTGKQVTLQAGAKRVLGRCHGIDVSGALLLETKTGMQRFFGGVVESWGT